MNRSGYPNLHEISRARRWIFIERDVILWL
jgi:hypothetical protein